MSPSAARWSNSPAAAAYSWRKADRRVTQYVEREKGLPHLSDIGMTLCHKLIDMRIIDHCLQINVAKAIGIIAVT